MSYLKNFLPGSSQQEAVENINACLVIVLEKYGPLEGDALTYILNRDFGHKLRPGYVEAIDVRNVIEDYNINDDFLLWPGPRKANGLPVDRCYRLKTQERTLPTIPYMQKSEYIGAYLDLLERFNLIRANPELASLPMSLINSLYFPKLEDEN